MANTSRYSFLSDDSSFYGDDDQKAEMEERVNAFDPVAWLANKPTTLMEVAAKNKEKQTIHEKASLYNIYEGIPHARQLTETVDEFLKRLPPATTDVSTSMPWIYIGNPYTPRPNKQNKDDDDDKFYDREEDEDGDIEMPEAIPLHDEEKDDVSKLIILGTNLMSEFETERFMLRKDMQGKPTSKLDAAIAKAREEMVKRLKEYAVEYKCVTGKWLLFNDFLEVNDVWSLIANKTATNDLGIAAKVAPRNPEQTDKRNPRLICVYTKDFTDVEDVTRVLRKLKDMGLCDTNRPIYYKCDAYTYLGINSGNEWGIRASIYSSTELLRPKSNKKIDPYFK